MAEPSKELKEAAIIVSTIDKQYRERARTMSELVNKLIVRRRGVLPRNYEEWLQDVDIIKRAAEKVGACQALNEVKISLWPPDPQPTAAAPPPSIPPA